MPSSRRMTSLIAVLFVLIAPIAITSAMSSSVSTILHDDASTEEDADDATTNKSMGQSWSISTLYEKLRRPAEPGLLSWADVADTEWETRWSELEREVAARRNDVESRLNELSRTIDAKRHEFEREVDQETKLMKRRFERVVLKQRQGWEWVCHTVRDHVGVVAGVVATFAGGLTPWLEKASVGMQSGHHAWAAANALNMTRGVWLKDATSVVVAGWVVKHEAGTPLEKIVPTFTVAYAFVRTAHKILDKLEEDFSSLCRTTVEAVVAVGGIAVLSVAPVPMPLVAASLCGTKLLLDSIAAEVVGNWVDMIERIGPQRLEKTLHVRRRLYKRFERKLLYPVRDAFHEIKDVASNNSITLQVSSHLREKVKVAVSRDMRLRLVWAITAAGVAFQQLMKKVGLFVSNRPDKGAYLDEG